MPPQQAANLPQPAQHPQQQQQRAQQDQEGYTFENSIQLPPNASPFHVASTNRIPAIRKWGSQNKAALPAGGGIGSNRVSPLQGTHVEADPQGSHTGA